MASENLVILIGNVGKDPEVSYSQSGSAVAKLSLATTKKWTGKDGSKQEKTSWHKITAFSKLAEIIGEYVKKGSGLYVRGELQYGSYEKDGVTRYTTDIIASQMQMLGGSTGQQGKAEPPDQDIPF